MYRLGTHGIFPTGAIGPKPTRLWRSCKHGQETPTKTLNHAFSHSSLGHGPKGSWDRKIQLARGSVFLYEPRQHYQPHQWTRTNMTCTEHQWVFDKSDDAEHMHWHCKNCGETKVTTPKTYASYEESLAADQEELIKKVIPVLSELNEQIDTQETNVHLATLFTFLFVKKFWQEATDLTAEGTNELRTALRDLSSEMISGLTRIMAFNFLWMIDRELVPETLTDPKIRRNIEAIYKLSESVQDNFTELFNKFPPDRGMNILFTDLLVEKGVKVKHVETYVSYILFCLSPVFFRQKEIAFVFIGEVINMMQSDNGSPQVLKEMVAKFLQPSTS